MNCPGGDGGVLCRTGPSRHDYQCPRCRRHWTIVQQTHSQATFNYHAPYASLVLRIDALLHPQTMCSEALRLYKRSICSPQEDSQDYSSIGPQGTCDGVGA